MRLALAAFVVALFTMGYVIAKPQGVTADDVTQMLVDNEIIDDPAEAQDAVTDPNAYPHYASRTIVCLWRDGQRRATCQRAPRSTYPDEDSCETVEWGAIDGLTARARQEGLHLNARVQCVEEYNT